MRKSIFQIIPCFFLICIFFNSLSAQTSKYPSDLMELGITGPVKTMTVYTYPAEQITKDSTRYKIQHNHLFDLQRIFYFNSKGQIDSMITISPFWDAGKAIFYRSYVIYEYDQNRIKKGYKFYNGKRILEQDTEIKWLDEYHYVQTNFTFDTGKVRQKTEEIWYTLNSIGREIAYEIRTFVPWTGNLKEISITVSTLKDRRYLEKKRFESYFDKGWDEVFYEIQKKDKNGNPLETIRLQGVRRIPNRMEVAEYSYFR